MCGITGLINDALPVQEIAVLVEKMSLELLHRGPDSGGLWNDIEYPVALGHRRLAIQDLSPAGHQPMISQSGRIVIVFNGEIYNFKELSKKLQNAGVLLKGHSDTEILLTLLEAQGIEKTLPQLEGMFSFVYWDKLNRTLTLCRDRLGEKPLYYGWCGSSFAFASELKPLIKYFHSSLSINRNALAEYMRHGYISAPYCIFNEFFKLQPGCYLTVRDSRKPSDFYPVAENEKNSPRRYWDVRTFAGDSPDFSNYNEHEIIGQLDLLLKEIIKEQSIADVPIGTFLSGGIDSTIVTSILQTISVNPIRTFTIGFNETSFNEAEYAKEIAKSLNTLHTEMYVSGQDCLDIIPKIPGIYDEPFADSSQIPVYIVSKLARSQVTVCLSGDGGDELFGGYNRYIHTQSLFKNGKYIPNFIKKILSTTIGNFSPVQWDRLYSAGNMVLPFVFKNQSNIGLKVKKALESIQIKSINELYKYLMSYWQAPELLVNDSKEYLSVYDIPDYISKLDFLTMAMLWDQMHYLPGDNLAKVDRASMAVSLETRLPLLDRRIVEFAWKIPNKFKFCNGRGKYILRQCLFKYVPKNLIERPKMGFSVPVGNWLRGSLRDWAENLLTTKKIMGHGYLNHELVDKVWKEHVSTRNDYSNALWTVLMFQAWMETYKIG